MRFPSTDCCPTQPIICETFIGVPLLLELIMFIILFCESLMFSVPMLLLFLVAASKRCVTIASKWS